MNTARWNSKAFKQLRKLQPKTQARIRDAVDLLLDFPKSLGDIKALKNHKCDYRLRVGGYRVLFNHGASLQIISIEEVRKRDERTY